MTDYLFKSAAHTSSASPDVLDQQIDFEVKAKQSAKTISAGNAVVPSVEMV